MASRLYVGNLPYNFTSQDLQQLFGPHGVVRTAEVIMDRVTGRSRGFGFVEMESDAASQSAIAALHEKDVGGRRVTVNEARERTPRAPGSGPRPSGPGGVSGGEGGGFGPPRTAGRGDRGERRDRYSDGGGRPRRRGGDDEP
jgi:RNA recognition motif-containing protein